MSKRKSRPRPQATTNEVPAVDALTVAWMLAVMTTLVCELGFVAARGYLLAVDNTATPIQVLAAVLLFAALVIGLISIGFMYAVLRSQRVTPPRGILVFATVVGAAPVATMLLRVLSWGLTPTP